MSAHLFQEDLDSGPYFLRRGFLFIWPRPHLFRENLSTWTLDPPVEGGFNYVDPGPTCLKRIYLRGPWTHLLKEDTTTWTLDPLVEGGFVDVDPGPTC